MGENPTTIAPTTIAPTRIIPNPEEKKNRIYYYDYAINHVIVSKSYNRRIRNDIYLVDNLKDDSIVQYKDYNARIERVLRNSDSSIESLLLSSIFLDKTMDEMREILKKYLEKPQELYDICVGNYRHLNEKYNDNFNVDVFPSSIMPLSSNPDK